MEKWRNWVLGQLWLNITAEKTHAKAMKRFKAVELVIYLAKHARCTASMLNHSWELLSLPENPTLSSFHEQNGETGFWVNFCSTSQAERPSKSPWNVSRHVIDVTNNAQLPCQVTHGDFVLFLKTRLSLLSSAKMAKMGLTLHSFFLFRTFFIRTLRLK